MTGHDTTALLRHFKALGNESRLKLVGLVADRERNVHELATLLALKEPTVSHHLAILKDAGFLAMRVEGNTHWYRLDLDAIRNISRSVFFRRFVQGPIRSRRSGVGARNPAQLY